MTQRIENSDRGITLNRGLAWGILVSLVTTIGGGGMWVGSNLSLITAKQEEHSRNGIAAALDRQELELRIRALESAATQTRVQFETLYRTMQEIKTEQKENNVLLRQMINERTK